MCNLTQTKARVGGWVGGRASTTLPKTLPREGLWSLEVKGAFLFTLPAAHLWLFTGVSSCTAATI